MGILKSEGIVEDGIFWDGHTFFVTCPECGHEQGDMGHNVACEECNEGLMPTHESFHELVEAYKKKMESSHD
jgi:methionyl-tRNA synthetase